MPIKIYVFSTHRADLTLQQYRDHYEKKHVPLIKSLLGSAAPVSYVRNYITRSSDPSSNHAAQLLMGQGDLDFDCVAESVYRDEAHLEETMRVLGDPEKARIREEDEKRFLDMEKLRVVVVESCGELRDGR